MNVYESSAATRRTLLAHPSLQRDALERTFNAFADANDDAQELDEAVCSALLYECSGGRGRVTI